MLGDIVEPALVKNAGRAPTRGTKAGRVESILFRAQQAR